MYRVCELRRHLGHFLGISIIFPNFLGNSLNPLPGPQPHFCTEKATISCKKFYHSLWIFFMGFRRFYSFFLDFSAFLGFFLVTLVFKECRSKIWTKL